MNLPKRILQMLGSAIAGELSKADPGHCVRVDHMGIDESIAACEQATAHLQPECLAYVVVPDAPTGDPVRIRLCLMDQNPQVFQHNPELHESEEVQTELFIACSEPSALLEPADSLLNA